MISRCAGDIPAAQTAKLLQAHVLLSRFDSDRRTRVRTHAHFRHACNGPGRPRSTQTMLGAAGVGAAGGSAVPPRRMPRHARKGAAPCEALLRLLLGLSLGLPHLDLVCKVLDVPLFLQAAHKCTHGYARGREEGRESICAGQARRAPWTGTAGTKTRPCPPAPAAPRAPAGPAPTATAQPWQSTVTVLLGHGHNSHPESDQK